MTIHACLYTDKTYPIETELAMITAPTHPIEMHVERSNNTSCASVYASFKNSFSPFVPLAAAIDADSGSSISMRPPEPCQIPVTGMLILASTRLRMTISPSRDPHKSPMLAEPEKQLFYSTFSASTSRALLFMISLLRKHHLTGCRPRA